MKTIVITEGRFDAAVLEKIFKSANLLDKTNVLPADGYSSALSKAKTYLSVHKSRVMLILDTDSVYENEILEKQEFVKSYVNYSWYPDRCKIIWFSPELETLLLHNKEFVSAVSLKPVSDFDINIGSSSPRKTLEIISGKKRESFIPLLDNDTIVNGFLEDTSVKEMLAFVEK